MVILPKVLSIPRESGGDRNQVNSWPRFDLSSAILEQLIVLYGDPTGRATFERLGHLLDRYRPHLLLPPHGKAGQAGDDAAPRTGLTQRDADFDNNPDSDAHRHRNGNRDGDSRAERHAHVDARANLDNDARADVDGDE